MSPRRLHCLPLLLLAALAGCDTYHFLAGTMSEDARKPVAALAHYEKFLASRPDDPRACEVHLRAAGLYKSVFGRCEDARRHWEAAARGFPRMKACVERATAALLDCPDYFPLEPGRTWVFVDSASGGKAARLEWEARPAAATGGETGSAGAISEALYAGNRRIKQSIERYRKADWALWLDEDGTAQPVLRYPFSEGQTWMSRRGKARIEHLVVGAPVDVTVRAGSFTGCLKVREKDLAFPQAWRYDYYCPDVGRVKTTIGGPGFENPNMELQRFGKM